MGSPPSYEEIIHRRKAVFGNILTEFGWINGKPPLIAGWLTLQRIWYIPSDAPDHCHHAHRLTQFCGEDFELSQLEQPQNENLGLVLDMDVLVKANKWTPEHIAGRVTVGYALGSAQKFTRLGNKRLARIFLRLATLEERAWNNMKVREWDAKKPFHPQLVLHRSYSVLDNILECCVLAGNQPDKFADILSQVYEDSFAPQEQILQKQRTGKKMNPLAEGIVHWMQHSGEPKLLSAIARLKEEKLVQFTRNGTKFGIANPPGVFGKKRWMLSALSRWWTVARKRNQQEAQ